MSFHDNKFLIMLWIGSVLFPFCAFGGTLYEKNRIRDPQGRVRYFHYYVPERLAAATPMVILLHGGTQDYSQNTEAEFRSE